ncbi:hypothetical protein NDU88_006669 [Pleurodeles waltl]|uniref:DMA domain-containing protein n=1 Tax=Pleurodeles waltl TaxID=8319 RepID=A0AAV7VQA4_PLEWA|nr:hypothetical protein NDU88_006669 [Pleurodeles waltl]
MIGPGSISSSDPESGNEAEWCRDGPGAPAAPSKQRDPLEILLKVFPQHRQSRLEDILHLCKGDVVQAIEQVLNGRDQITAQRARLPKGPARWGKERCARARTHTLQGTLLRTQLWQWGLYRFHPVQALQSIGRTLLPRSAMLLPRVESKAFDSNCASLYQRKLSEPPYPSEWHHIGPTGLPHLLSLLLLHCPRGGASATSCDFSVPVNQRSSPCEPSLYY